MTGGAGHLSQAGNLVQFGKLSPGGSNLFERTLGIIVLTGRVAAPVGSSSLS
jgi:hypothetical protein